MQRIKHKQNQINLDNLAIICNRYGVSDYTATPITASALVDYGVIDETNS